MPHTNRLIHSTSPYLLQHAHNPVDWFEWGPEALQKAKAEGKPILVSIGYSSCHWCHVMERESFEHDDIAAVMNASYVCIKVDREERPDIDSLYMEAVQALGVNGGWPLNVFLTPEQKPFFGGTYFSPASWVQVLQNIHKAFEGNRQQIEDTAEELRLHLLRSDVQRFKQTPSDSALQADLSDIFTKLQAHFDKQWGGMDRAPKFIMPSVWLFLLRHHYLTKDHASLEQVVLTLQRTASGGIYDQIGGGFARYSVDAYWFAPHFEKMLYDNAQLLSLYAEAYAITKSEIFKRVVYETFDWLQLEMTHPLGGFYSALDADSEGEEGQFYVWKKTELEKLLGENEPLISEYYNVKPGGNWEFGNNILTRHKADDVFLQAHGLSDDEWKTLQDSAKHTLHEARSKRVRPGLDDKVITAWNAMTVCGLVDAYRFFADQTFLDAAIRNMLFMEREVQQGNVLYRSWKGKHSVTTGFLDDYAYVIQAQLRLYQATFDERWIEKAAVLIDYVMDQFYDDTDGFFYYSSTSAEPLLSRKKEIFDNVIPSSNAIMAQNLFQAGTLLEREEWKSLAVAMAGSLAHLIKSEPNYMSQWAIAHTEIKKGMAEVALVGKDLHAVRQQWMQQYAPYALLQGTEHQSKLPLLHDKIASGDGPTLFVCYNKTCQLPVHRVEDAIAQLQ
ncbi:thioredoxin domain-containing protein [Chryseolinea lacunae]|uniref:Thioredoxin domain-containing protein n=1 Tax=Chryseolinea lacunae TaxID=2801331 RepID=A0ABS1KVN8_9BACT|nr:thioredoxin domain-containing protein [Chryseolinea lacunae]MBL0743516.1 thioredoxin domain-containing protein [Chryseolinea lacunae]